MINILFVLQHMFCVNKPKLLDKKYGVNVCDMFIL